MFSQLAIKAYLFQHNLKYTKKLHGMEENNQCVNENETKHHGIEIKTYYDSGKKCVYQNKPTKKLVNKFHPYFFLSCLWPTY